MEDCTRCGACCFSESPRHARVTGDDYSRLGDDAEHYVEFLGNQAFMRIEDGHCAALVVTPGPIVTADPPSTHEADGGTFLCAIYERRPAVCRDLARGSPACEGELSLKRERPKRRLALLRSKPVALSPSAEGGEWREAAPRDQGSDIEG